MEEVVKVGGKEEKPNRPSWPCLLCVAFFVEEEGSESAAERKEGEGKGSFVRWFLFLFFPFHFLLLFPQPAAPSSFFVSCRLFPSLS